MVRHVDADVRGGLDEVAALVGPLLQVLVQRHVAEDDEVLPEPR